MKKNLFPLLLLWLLLGVTACRPAENTDDTATDSVSTTTNLPSTLLNNNGSTPTVAVTEELPDKVVNSIQVVNTQEFSQRVCELNNPKGFQYKGSLPAIVDFYTDWCGPCRAINPSLVELAETYAGKIIIYKVNIDKCPEVAEVFGIESIPTLLYMKPNTQPTATVGALSKEEIQQIIHDFLLK